MFENERDKNGPKKQERTKETSNTDTSRWSSKEIKFALRWSAAWRLFGKRRYFNLSSDVELC